MTRKYNPEENTLIERAISFLVDEYRRSGTNPKPVMFHSLRVACKLAEHNAEASTVTAAVLHDLIEDTDTTVEPINSEFGKEVAKLVAAASFKSSITDKTRQYKDMFERVSQAGRPAMELKCVDILDNSDYYEFGNDKNREQLLLQKLGYFLNVTKVHLDRFPPYRELEARLERFLKEFEDIYKRRP